jgi:hypothetical protein
MVKNPYMLYTYMTLTDNLQCTSVYGLFRRISWTTMLFEGGMSEIRRGHNGP